MVDLFVTLAQGLWGLCIAGLLCSAYLAFRSSDAKPVRKSKRYAGVWARYSAYRKCGPMPAGRIRF